MATYPVLVATSPESSTARGSSMVQRTVPAFACPAAFPAFTGAAAFAAGAASTLTAAASTATAILSGREEPSVSEAPQLARGLWLMTVGADRRMRRVWQVSAAMYRRVVGSRVRTARQPGRRG